MKHWLSCPNRAGKPNALMSASFRQAETRQLAFMRSVADVCTLDPFQNPTRPFFAPIVVELGTRNSRGKLRPLAGCASGAPTKSWQKSWVCFLLRCWMSCKIPSVILLLLPEAQKRKRGRLRKSWQR